MKSSHDCGHSCCDERHDPNHDHFLPPEKCPPCTTQRPQDEGGLSLPPHLCRSFTDRGFTHLPPLPLDGGGSVEVYESSAADQPKVWLRVREQHGYDIAHAVAHMTAEDALRLAEQLRFLVEHHYQAPPTEREILAESSASETQHYDGQVRDG